MKRRCLSGVFRRVLLLVICAIHTATAIHVCGGSYCMYCMYNMIITTLSLQQVDTCIHTQLIAVVRYRYSLVRLFKLKCIYVLRLKIKGTALHTQTCPHMTLHVQSPLYTPLCVATKISCVKVHFGTVCVCVAVCMCMTSFGLGSSLWW